MRSAREGVVFTTAGDRCALRPRVWGSTATLGGAREAAEPPTDRVVSRNSGRRPWHCIWFTPEAWSPRCRTTFFGGCSLPPALGGRPPDRPVAKPGAEPPNPTPSFVRPPPTMLCWRALPALRGHSVSFGPGECKFASSIHRHLRRTKDSRGAAGLDLSRSCPGAP